jgi:excisionase family DNA binding protein
LRRTEFLRPEGLLPVAAVAKRLGVSAATVHEAINAGKLRSVLFGSVRRVRPEDLKAYEQSLNASRPPADEDWCTAAELIHATRLSRSQAYRLLARGDVPFRSFAGTRYIRSEDINLALRTIKKRESREGTA